MKYAEVTMLIILILSGVYGEQVSAEAAEKPKLLLVMVIDQFRADYLMRFEKKFLPAQSKNHDVGGFAYLMTNGAYFPFGQYDTHNTITAPGHATILSGTYPYQSGITMNAWYDREKEKFIESVDDDNFPIVSGQEEKNQTGVSPKNSLATTLGDELKNAGYPSHVVSLALKSRAAVLLGGQRADLAFWYRSDLHQWVSSQYYLPDGKLPTWLAQLNHEMKPHLNETMEWKIESPTSGYSAEDAMPLLDEGNAGKIGGKNFPHHAKIGSTGAMAMPFGLALTRIAAEKAFDAYQLGRGKATDILALSFSSHDAVGHAFGPNSREMEEMTSAEDREISHLLNYIRKKMPNGLKDITVVLTADHGASPAPTWLQKQKIASGTVDEAEIIPVINERLNAKFGKPSQGEWALALVAWDVYLNRKEVMAKNLRLAEVQAEAKAVILKNTKISYVATSTELETGVIPPGIHGRQVAHSFFPSRSGDLTLIAKPYFILKSPRSANTTDHCSGYAYDRTVPIIIAGTHIRPSIYATRAEVVDIAPTLSFLLGVVPPSLSEGRVLSEIFASGRP
jgi:predicted AlkP superfamily pyrophosphatase or phosphodiesterase